MPVKTPEIQNLKDGGSSRDAREQGSLSDPLALPEPQNLHPP